MANADDTPARLQRVSLTEFIYRCGSKRAAFQRIDAGEVQVFCKDRSGNPCSLPRGFLPDPKNFVNLKESSAEQRPERPDPRARIRELGRRLAEIHERRGPAVTHWPSDPRPLMGFYEIEVLVEETAEPAQGAWAAVEELLDLKAVELSRGPITPSAANLAFEWVLRGLQEDRWPTCHRDKRGERRENDLQRISWSRDKLNLILGKGPAWRRTDIFCLEVFVLSNEDLPPQNEARAVQGRAAPRRGPHSAASRPSKEEPANLSKPEPDTQQRRVQDILKQLSTENRLMPKMQPVAVETLVLPKYRKQWRGKKGPHGPEYVEPSRRTTTREYVKLYPRK